MKLAFALALIPFAAATYSRAVADEPQQRPNVLWILTDDQRYDSIRAFNQILHQRDQSELGYVESPNVDELAAKGTTFINTYCHAQGCAPSRASMHLGRYPHHSGIYEFEYFNNKADHWKPSLPECMQQLGYQTMHVGKLGVRIRTLQRGKPRKLELYQTNIDFKKSAAEGLTDWTKGPIAEIAGVDIKSEGIEGDFFFSPDGTVENTSGDLARVKGFENHSEQIDAKYDLLRMYNSKKPKRFGAGEIIGGVSSQPAGKTRDGYYTAQLKDYLQNPNKPLAAGSQHFVGVDPSRPLFAHIGFDFPHTPVLPPHSFRSRFADRTYQVPEFDKEELASLPPQLKKLITINHSDHYTEAEKQQMVRDYYAFCAYGDHLVGEAADAFVQYSEQHRQPWMVVYVCGDHGWKLNEHGAIAKFSPWKMDSLDPIIVVSSDKESFPAGKVVTDFTEFVDIMPTILAAAGADLRAKEFGFLDGYDLAKVASGELEPRDYVVGESHAVTGPRATIRTKDFMFSIKSRPDKKRGQNMDWAMNASYEELEPVLYQLSSDPAELHNLAYDKSYQSVAQGLRNKLLNIVIGDGRVEVDWGPKATGTKSVISDFAIGADDKRLKL
ncbi:Arylsulfatase [Rubripirellula amarantea]|uniref:Arylsulfatase n=2 Tax=Rubripirellula amarantea TaxID=2527999 RepID=A0A5C5WWG7_9BACT|nr:Arylsulfatase [Rubripirellula amarantea]